MILHLIRTAKKADYTIGRLYIEGRYFCDTLEDTDRGLTMVGADPTKKIKKLTAIPAGFYEIDLNTQSPKYAAQGWARELCDAKMPRLKDVPLFGGILIHPGNTPTDTEGCILVGVNSVAGRVLQSRAMFEKLMNYLLLCKRRGERCFIAIG
jgi:hypothetical protein